MKSISQEHKVGAIICTKNLPASAQLEYEALLFISDIPGEVTDDQLKQKTEALLFSLHSEECNAIIIRSDINASTNEITEQFNGLNNDSGKAKIISYNQLSFALWCQHFIR